MHVNGLVKTKVQLRIKHCCPSCQAENHNWQQVYTENNSQLNKMANTYISWCEQDQSHVLIQG